MPSLQAPPEVRFLVGEGDHVKLCDADPPYTEIVHQVKSSSMGLKYLFVYIVCHPLEVAISTDDPRRMPTNEPLTCFVCIANAEGT